MDIEKRQLTTIKDTSVFLLSKPSDFARHFLYYMIGLGHFYATEYYTEARPSNAYDSFLLMYILNGKLYAEEGGSGCEASAGSIVLIDCYSRHRYRAIVPTEFVYIHFDGNNARAFYEEITRSRGRNFLNAHFEEQSEKLLHLCSSIESGEMPSEGDVSVLIHGILCELCEKSATEYSLRYSAAVRNIVRYIDENYASPIGIRDLSRKCNLSPQHMSRLFRKETGFSPYAYILEKRMHIARELLSFSDCTVEEVSDRVGYSSSVNFSNAFKKRYGLSPGQFRRSQ